MEDLATSKGQRAKNKKVIKVIKLSRDVGPAYPSLNSHKYSSIQGQAAKRSGNPTSRTTHRERGASGGSTGRKSTRSRS